MNKEALSAEQAIAALSGDGMPDDALDAEEEQDTEELDAEAEFQAEADEEGDDPETDPDADEEEEGDEPGTAIEAPQFLDEKERAAFAALPREAQEMLLKHDKALVADYTRKTQAVAEEKKAVQAQRQQLDRVVSQFGEVLPEAEREFAEWQKVDWVGLAQKVTAEEYNQYRASAEEAGKRVQSLRQQKAQAEKTRFDDFLSEQKQLLTEIAATQAPEFLKPDAGERVIKPLVSYIKGLGYSDEEITHIGAQDMIIAYKAMKYDQMVAARKNGKPALTPKPDAKSTGKPVRAGAAVSTSKRAVTKDVQQRFMKTGSKDLAIEMLKNFD